ncbi:MAG: 2-oxo acid dehydrogenase subunit E2 [Acidimicrobiia bacterium]|nr:2-oxo acid dehydrogenase subunit E2 [Acidimicrobiia bacterium]
MAAKKGFSQWRKVAMATWKRPQDPMIRISLDIEAAAPVEYARAAQRATGEHVTVTHIVGKAVARAIASMPGVNGRILFGNFLPNPTTDVFFLVSLRTDLVDGEREGGEAARTDLSGAKVTATDTKPPWTIAAELNARAEKIRSRHDPTFQRTKNITQSLPPFVLRPMLDVITFLVEDLGLAIPPLGLDARPFGSVLVSNVGMLGLEAAFAPLPAISRAVATIIVGEVAPKAVVEDGQVVARDMIPLGVSVDHRFIDGYQGGVMMQELKEYLSDPAKYDPLP